MSENSEKIKDQPDSLVKFGDRTVKEIREFAKTKFVKALVNVSVNREQKCFDVFLRDANEADIIDFENMWTMCKIYALKSVQRKK